MTIYTNYDPTTGAILGTGTATEETLDAMIRFGATALLHVHADTTTHYVDLTGDGPQLVEYTAGERAALAALAPGWVWQMPERIAVDQRTLSDAKNQAWARIKAARAAAEHAPFNCNGNLFDGDEVSTGRITGAVSLAMMAAMAGQSFANDWTLADNSIITLDGPAMMAVGIALGVRVGAVFDIARTLRDQIDTATSAAQLDTITWPQ